MSISIHYYITYRCPLPLILTAIWGRNFVLCFLSNPHATHGNSSSPFCSRNHIPSPYFLLSYIIEYERRVCSSSANYTSSTLLDRLFGFQLHIQKSYWCRDHPKTENKPEKAFRSTQCCYFSHWCSEGKGIGFLWCFLGRYFRYCLPYHQKYIKDFLPLSTKEWKDIYSSYSFPPKAHGLNYHDDY